MPRWCWLLVGVLFVPVPLQAQESPEIQLLDRQFRQAIGRADRSVVGIRIGRSEDYPAPDEKTPGKLGRYDAADLLSKLPAEERAARQRIQDLDLSATDHVPEAIATGVILDKAGLILVPAHAVARARKLYVKLPGNRGSYADIYALDPRSDLAVLKLLDPPEGLVPATLGDGGKLEKGQLVLLLNNSFTAQLRDPAPTASWGMISNLRQRLPGPANETDRTRQTIHHYGTLLQIQSRLNLPISGGIVLNLKGEVVGMTTAQAAMLGSDVPGGFAVPFDDGIQRIVAVLLKGQEVEYGFLGVRLESRPGRGAEVSSAAINSPAWQAGLRGGETIIRIDGQPIQDIDDLFLVVGTHLAGSTVEVEYQTRGLGARKTRVTLAKFWVQSPLIATNKPQPVSGLHVDWSSLLSQRPFLGRFEGPPTLAGVMVREIDPKSPAAATGLQVDDLITHVGKTPVATPAEFYKALEAVQGPVELTYLNSERRKGQVTLPR